MKILDGKKISNEIREELKTKVEKLISKGIKPHLCIFRVGEDPNSITYMKYKKQAALNIGIKYSELIFSENITENELINKIEEVNKESSITGLIVQFPLPKHISMDNIIKSIKPSKDVDGLTDENTNNIFNDHSKVMPCTPTGILEMIRRYNIDVKNKKAVVLGRSKIVGHPMKLMLETLGANVTVCHSQTKDITIYTKEADIIVSATGVPHLITSDIVKEGVIIFDVGIKKENGKIIGDVDFKNVSKKASYITPNPGGVGPMTISILLKNIVLLADK